MKYILLASLILSTVFTFGQTKKVQFYGLNLLQYQRPVDDGTGKYRAYYQNQGDTREQGRIVVDESNKTFAIKFLNGDNWICKYSKVTSQKVYDQILGNITKVIYKGKWTDDNGDCELVIATTENSECVFLLNSTKIIDDDYGINAWKKVFKFFNMNECLTSQ